jgi:hypothetical protein
LGMISSFKLTIYQITGTLGHDLKRSLMDPSSRYGKTFRIIF